MWKKAMFRVKLFPLSISVTTIKVVVRTADDEDFVVETEYMWNEEDLVSIKIAPEAKVARVRQSNMLKRTFAGNI